MNIRTFGGMMTRLGKFVVRSMGLCALLLILSAVTATAQIPSTLGWYQIPNTQMINVCPPGMDCSKVITSWSGGTADTTRNRLIVWGGGHGDYGGNEVYALDLNALTINRLNNPSPPSSTCVEVLSDGTPPSRHTYDGLAYIAHADRMSSFTGSMNPTGCGSDATWTLNMSNLQWTLSNLNNPHIDSGGHAASAYDPNTKNVFIHTESYGNFASYNYDTNTLKILATGEIIPDPYYVTAVVDPKRKTFFMFGNGHTLKIDISGNDPAYNMITLNGSGCGFANDSTIEAPGAAYDPVQDRIVGWSGGNTVYLYNPDTDSCTSVTYPNGPGAQQALGTNGRFGYFPVLNVFALVNDASQNAYALRLTNGTPPPPDTTPPTVAITAPTNGSTVSGTVSVSGTAADNVAVSNVQVSVDGGTYTAASGTTNWAFSLNTTTLSNASHTIAAKATDTSGNVSTVASITVTVNNSAPPPDTTPPSVPTGLSASAVSSSQINLNWTASTDNVGVTGYKIFRGGSQIATTAGITFSDTGLTASTAYSYTVSAFDAAGNNSAQSASASATTLSSGGGTSADQDFANRCSAPGVLVCEGWDKSSDFTPASLSGGYASGLYPANDGTYQGLMDTSIKTSGAGALKFNIRAGSVVPFGTLPAGQWGQQFGPDGNGYVFGQGTTFYMQFRLRLSPEMLNFNWPSVSGTGWKVFIVYGPIPGPSCTGTQFVQENSYQNNIFTGYTSCGSPGLETNNGNPPYLKEQGDYNCPYDSNGGYTSNPNCFAYPSNTWITEYWKVTLGTFGQPNTHFEAWAGATGQPLKKWIDLPNFNFGDPADANTGLMRLFLTPYFSGATASTINPAAAMWFDELIVSKQPIATPLDNNGTPPPPDTTPPSVPTNLAASAVSSSQINLSWTASTDNVGVTGYKVLRCQGSGCIPSVQVAAPTSNSFQDSGLTASTAYTYTVSAFDAAGNNSAQSAPASATTQTPPPPDTVPPTAAITSPANGSTISGTITVTGTAADNVAVSNVQVSVDGGAYVAASGTANWTFSLNTTSLTNASHTISAKATDTSGNVSTVASITVTVNNPVGGSCATSSTLWQNWPFAPQTGTFTAQFDATPNAANMDGVTALSMVAAGAYTDIAAIVRFNNLGNIDARNGGAYAAAATIPYTAGTNYHFRMQVDVANHVYSAYVTPQGGSEQLVGSNFAFRTEQSTASNLANWSLYAATPSHQVCNFSVSSSTGGITDTTPPSVPTGLTAVAISSSSIVVNWSASTDNVGVTGYKVFRCQGAGCIPNAQIATTASTSLQDTGLTASTTYVYKISAFDAVGNVSALSASASATTLSSSTVSSNLPPVVSVIGSNATDVDPVTPGLQIYDNTSVTYTGSASDPNGGTITWQWLYSTNGGAPVLMASGTGTVQPFTFNYPAGIAPKTYVWILSANNGVSTVQQTLTVNVIVRPSNPPPTPPPADAKPGLRDTLVFPNPTVSQNPTIRTFLGQVASVEITIFDASGQVVHSASLGGTPTGIANGQYYYDYVWSGIKFSGVYFAVIHGKAADGSIIRARTKFAVVK